MGNGKAGRFFAEVKVDRVGFTGGGPMEKTPPAKQIVDSLF